MITKEQAIQLGNGEINELIHEDGCKRFVGPKGGKKEFIYRWRVNGKCHVWKTRPKEFALPIKFGLKEYGQINEFNCHKFHLASHCPLNKEDNS